VANQTPGFDFMCTISFSSPAMRSIGSSTTPVGCLSSRICAQGGLGQGERAAAAVKRQKAEG